MRFITIIAAIAILASGCAQKYNIKKQDNILRVFMHEPNDYSIMYKQIDELKTIRIGRARVMADVPEGKPMWAKWLEADDSHHNKCEAEIHIHSPKDIDGGAWNHGKRGRGQTVVLAH
jgi:hypothetical protein